MADGQKMGIKAGWPASLMYNNQIDHFHLVTSWMERPVGLGVWLRGGLAMEAKHGDKNGPRLGAHET